MALKAASRGKNRSDGERLGLGRVTARSAPRPGADRAHAVLVGVAAQTRRVRHAAEVARLPDEAVVRDRHRLGAGRRVHQQVRSRVDPAELLRGAQAVAKALVVEVAGKGDVGMLGATVAEVTVKAAEGIDGSLIVPVHALIRFPVLQPVAGAQGASARGRRDSVAWAARNADARLGSRSIRASSWRQPEADQPSVSARAEEPTAPAAPAAEGRGRPPLRSIARCVADGMTRPGAAVSTRWRFMVSQLVSAGLWKGLRIREISRPVIADLADR